jgi:flagellar motor switch protein FliM
VSSDTATARTLADGAIQGENTELAGVRTYDFRRPTKLSRDHIRILEMEFDTFARQWATLLTTTLRSISSVQLKSIQQMSYDEYVSSLAAHTTMFILAVDPIPGAAILEFSNESAMTIVDHLLGGPGLAPQPTRPFTEIESVLVKGVVERVLHELRYAIEGLVAIEPALVSVEHNPQFAQAAAPSDLVLNATFDVKIGQAECDATLVLPFGGILPHLDKAVGGNAPGRDRGDREAAAKAVAKRLGDVEVDVSVSFLPTMVRMGDVVSLKVGDVIRLRHPVTEPLSVTSAGIEFAQGMSGSEGQNRVCCVVHPTEGSK